MRYWFVLRYWRVEILPSASRHDVEAADIDHAINHAVVLEEIDDDPLLELVVLDRPRGPAVIHAMPMRTKYEPLLNKRR